MGLVPKISAGTFSFRGSTAGNRKSEIRVLTEAVWD